MFVFECIVVAVVAVRKLKIKKKASHTLDRNWAWKGFLLLCHRVIFAKIISIIQREGKPKLIKTKDIIFFSIFISLFNLHIFERLCNSRLTLLADSFDWLSCWFIIFEFTTGKNVLWIGQFSNNFQRMIYHFPNCNYWNYAQCCNHMTNKAVRSWWENPWPES